MFPEDQDGALMNQKGTEGQVLIGGTDGVVRTWRSPLFMRKSNALVEYVQQRTK